MQTDTSRAGVRLGICISEVQKHCKETAHTLHVVGMPEILAERINARRIH